MIIIVKEFARVGIMGIPKLLSVNNVIVLVRLVVVLIKIIAQFARIVISI